MERRKKKAGLGVGKAAAAEEEGWTPIINRWGCL